MKATYHTGLTGPLIIALISYAALIALLSSCGPL